MGIINIQLILPRAMICPNVNNVKTIMHKTQYIVDVQAEMLLS